MIVSRYSDLSEEGHLPQIKVKTEGKKEHLELKRFLGLVLKDEWVLFKENTKNNVSKGSNEVYKSGRM